ncbi:MAG: hypothetical protein LBM05_01215, partial [Endomicrobium sp.]|nr:hypothetical protein [Endomicrobium sp.]
MKKFVMVIVFMLTSIKYNFVFANNNSLYNFLQYKLSGETTFNIHTTSQRNTQNVLYSVDLKFIKLLTENNKIVLCINTGSSLDNFFNTVNSKNEYLHVKISKLFYETILFSDKLTITVGKIGFFSFFANNIYT